MVKKEKQPKFNFEELKAGATSQNPVTRKKTFQEYFEKFQEFPSYLFDNSHGIDSVLHQTIQDLEKDPDTTEAMQKGLALLLERVPAHN
ncbi:MAG: hypothetical protein Q8R25_00585 [bacterium]|nr:hypothetical protein [bacterium]